MAKLRHLVAVCFVVETSYDSEEEGTFLAEVKVKNQVLEAFGKKIVGTIWSTNGYGFDPKDAIEAGEAREPLRKEA